ncbi:hypothetical protein D3C85_839260 [compost metagenome]
MRAFAELVQGQRAGAVIATQDLHAQVAQFLALGVGRQFRGVADADGNLAAGQHRRHQQEIHSAHHHDHVLRFFTNLLEQWRKQSEFGVVGQSDTKHIAAGGGLEILGPADRPGNGVHCRLQFLENLQCPQGRLQGASIAHQQRIVEQIAQFCQRCADGRLAEEQLFPGPGQVLLEHQGFENHQQVHVHAAQVVAVHGGGARWGRSLFQ